MFGQRKIYSQKFRAEAGEGGDAGSGTPDIAKLIQEAVTKEVIGLKAKNAELIDKVKSSTEALKAFDGIDAVKTREMLARFENDAEAKLISEGKMSEVINARTERLRADYDKKLAESEAKSAAAVQRAQAFQGRVLDDEIRAAAAKVGIHAQAIEDALFRGRAMFTLGEDGKAVQIGQDGAPVLGKDGKSNFTPAEWLEGMKEAAPHWFPVGSSGGGAGGDNGGQGSLRTIKLSDLNSMRPKARAAAMSGGAKVIE